MFAIKIKYDHFKETIMILLASMMLSVLFSYTKFSKHFITIVFLIIMMFIVMFAWYMASTFIVQRFRCYHNYVTKYYRKYLSYGPIFSFLLSDLVILSIIIAFSQLKVNTTFKSSISFMLMVYSILLSIISLYTKYRFYSLLKKKDSFKHNLGRMIENRNDKNVNLFRITNKMPLDPLDMNLDYRKYNKKLMDCISHIDGIGLNEKDKERLYLGLRKRNRYNKFNKLSTKGEK